MDRRRFLKFIAIAGIISAALTPFIYDIYIKKRPKEELQEDLKPPEEPKEILGILKPKMDTEYWTAYESPSEHGLSLAWGEGYLWLADIYDGTIHQVRETPDGLEIIGFWDLRINPSNVFQMRDITFDGKNLWSVDWGHIQRHNMETMEIEFDYSEDNQNPPWENMHHLWSIAWDGSYIWTAPEQLNRHNSVDYHVEAVYPSGVFPMNMSFRGEGELWISDSVYGFIYRLDMSQLPPQGYPRKDIDTCDCYDLQAEIPPEAYPKIIGVYSIIERPYGIAWSDTNLWVYDLATKMIYKIKKLPDYPLDPKNDYLKEEKYTVPGEIMGEVVWTKDKSPYLIEGLHIPEGSTLIIEPGVKVYVKGEVIVQGTLRAIGTPDKPIIFTHAEWDKYAYGSFFFGDPNHEKVYSEGEEASASILKYVVIRYFSGMGIEISNCLPTIQYCTLEKNMGLLIDLDAGNYTSFKFIGNKISEGGDGIKMEIGPEANISEIIIRENVFTNVNGAAIYIEYRSPRPLKVMVEHNIMDHIFGASNVFDGSFEVVFNNNLLNDLVAYRGFMPSRSYRNEFKYNYLRHIFQAAIQLDEPESYGEVEVKYNTVIDGIVDPSFGNPNITVEYNNILFSPEIEAWPTGPINGLPNNWWGTSDIEEIKKHLYLENGKLDPILDKPNGVGFVRGRVIEKNTGKPISEAEIRIEDRTIYTSVTGEFFTSLRETEDMIEVVAKGYPPKNIELEITPATIKEIEIQI